MPVVHPNAAAIDVGATMHNYRAEHLFALEQALALYDVTRRRRLPATPGSKPC